MSDGAGNPIQPPVTTAMILAKLAVSALSVATLTATGKVQGSFTQVIDGTVGIPDIGISQVQTVAEGGYPFVRWVRSANAANARTWDAGLVGTDFLIRAVSDDYATVLNCLSLSRAGAATFSAGVTCTTLTTSDKIASSNAAGVLLKSAVRSDPIIKLLSNSDTTHLEIYAPSTTYSSFVVASEFVFGSYIQLASGVKLQVNGGGYFAGLTSITTDTGMTAPAPNAVHITEGKIRCGNTSATSIQTEGGVTVGARITTVSAVPGSFADLAAVRTWLATNFT